MKQVGQNATPRKSRTPKLPRVSEHVEAVNLFRLVQLHEARHPELRWFHAIPNGGARSAVTGAKMKAEGVRRGVPDYALPVRRGDQPGLVIELKARGGRPTPEQIEWMQHYESQDWCVVLATGWAEAWDAIRRYLGIVK